MRRAVPWIVGLVTLALGAILIVLKPTPSPVDPYQPPHEMRIPEFSMIDRDSAPVTHELLDGEYTVLDFFFTSCPLYCPGMTAAMRRVQDEVVGDGLRLMSLSIDGEHDTPEMIARYANGFGVDPERWVFATGPTSDVWSVIDELGFLVAYEEGSTVSTPEGGSMAMINHPTRLLLVGPDRTILGMYRYTEPEEIDALIARLNDLLD